MEEMAVEIWDCGLFTRSLFTRRLEGMDGVDSRITRVRVYSCDSGKSTKPHPTHFTCFQGFLKVIITHIFVYSSKNEFANV